MKRSPLKVVVVVGVKCDQDDESKVRYMVLEMRITF
jgi:hypothetical protein